MSDTTNVRVTASVFDCQNCANTIERVLQKEHGVEAVAADEQAQALQIRFDQSRVEERRLRQLVEEWGYGPEPESG